MPKRISHDKFCFSLSSLFYYETNVTRSRWLVRTNSITRIQCGRCFDCNRHRFQTFSARFFAPNQLMINIMRLELKVFNLRNKCFCHFRNDLKTCNWEFPCIHRPETGIEESDVLQSNKREEGTAQTLNMLCVFNNFLTVEMFRFRTLVRSFSSLTQIKIKEKYCFLSPAKPIQIDILSFVSLSNNVFNAFRSHMLWVQWKFLMAKRNMDLLLVSPAFEHSELFSPFNSHENKL